MRVIGTGVLLCLATGIAEARTTAQEINALAIEVERAAYALDHAQASGLTAHVTRVHTGVLPRAIEASGVDIGHGTMAAALVKASDADFAHALAVVRSEPTIGGAAERLGADLEALGRVFDGLLGGLGVGRGAVNAGLGDADGDGLPNIDWAISESRTGVGTAVPGLESDRSALFWFFNATNFEMLVKVLDGCNANGNFWVFASASTNVEYTLTVTDSVAGQGRFYRNPAGTSSRAVTDTRALPTCP